MSFFEKLLQDMYEASEKRRREAKLTEQDIRDLIDLTLVLGDEEWFMELTERLNALTV
ncbi:hypothetical protein CHH55_17105 [Niallia circulans]|uniref:IDEAL domain-containing protein n=1 Tax=Niallia circulans TaxID=1397 RepID=UPI000BA6E6F1|nr:IDEAL domain-containing protein [Niallia circulans]PAD86686.1 hypothetical protein CHH55_17105 [Niallia circulans]